MSSYTTAYKSGSVASVNGSVTAVSGFTPQASDVGRILVITTGDARLQHRMIESVSGQNVTLSHAWDTNPFIDTSSDGRATDILPSSGDSVVVSYDLDDLISTDSDISQVNANQVSFSGTFDLHAGVYIHCKNKHINLNSENVQIRTGAGFIFGYYSYVDGVDGYPVDSCNITDVASGTGGDQWRLNGGSFGSLDMYGGTLYLQNIVFSRLYVDTPAPEAVQVRIMFVSIYGSFGSRVEGNRSMLIMSNVDSISTFGLSNPRGSVARIELTARNCNQAAYVWLVEGPSGRASFPQLEKINTNVLRVVGAGNGQAGANQVYEIVAKKSEVDAAPLFANVQNGTPTHILRYGNLVKPRFINADLSDVSGELQLRLIDVTDAIVDSNAVTNSRYPEFFARHTDIATTSGPKTLSDGTQFAPYTLSVVQYGKLFLGSTVSVEDTFDAALTMLDDPSITEPDKNVVLAYPTIDTASQFYDAYIAWLEANITNQRGFEVSISGRSVDTGDLSVIVDNTANKNFDIVGQIITIRSSDFTDNISSTGTVEATGAAKVSGTIFDANGDASLTFSGILGWSVFGSKDDSLADTNAIGNGSVAENFRFTLSVGTTYYLALETEGGSRITQKITPTQSDATAVALDTSAQLATMAETLNAISNNALLAADHARAANVQTKRPLHFISS